jgi:FixJ family two-component response regulator
MNARPAVFLLDDEVSVVVALGRMLQSEGYEIFPCTSPAEFLSCDDPDIVGCLVADVLMPDMSGLELQRAMLKRGSLRPIVFVTAQHDVRTTVQAMRAGAVTFLPKPVRRAELIPAVREAVQRDAATRAIQRERREVEVRLESLTSREMQVMKLVATGLLNKQIAAELGTTERTVKAHRGRLMEKMQVKSAAALVAMLSRAAIGAMREPGLPPVYRDPDVRA